MNKISNGGIKDFVNSWLGGSENVWLTVRCSFCGCLMVVVVPQKVYDYRSAHKIEGWALPCSCAHKEVGIA